MIIRPATLSDIQGLLELEALFPGDRLSRRSFRYLLIHANADILIHDADGAIGGNVVTVYRRNSRLARIYSLIVHPSLRRQGIAKRLIEGAIKAAMTRGCRKLALEVRADNLEAQQLYQSLGFIPNRCIDGYYEDGSPAIRFEKELFDVQ